MLIETGERTVTREEQKIITEKLKNIPSLVRVHLGCVAIHFFSMGIEVDLVFSNLEIGKQLPVSEEEKKQMEIPAIRFAAVGLKVAVNDGQTRRVANFLLERLVMHAFSQIISLDPQKNEKNLTGLEVFIAAAQAIVETKGEILLSPFFQPTNPTKQRPRSLSPSTLSAVTTRLSFLLHSFCLSRYFLQDSPDKKGFENFEQIEEWLLQLGYSGFITPSHPGWLFGIKPPEGFALLSRSSVFLEQNPVLNPRSSSPCITEQQIREKHERVFGSPAFIAFTSSPLVKFLIYPEDWQQEKKQEQEQQQQLQQQQWNPVFFDSFIINRSPGWEIAQRMKSTLCIWKEGEKLMKIGHIGEAIEVFLIFFFE